VGFDAADGLGGGPPDGPHVVLAQFDGHGGVGDVDGDHAPRVEAAEGDLLPGHHDHSGVAGSPLYGTACRIESFAPAEGGQEGIGRDVIGDISTEPSGDVAAYLLEVAVEDLAKTFGTPPLPTSSDQPKDPSDHLAEARHADYRAEMDKEAGP
jgi:hypothetical protein